jgi:hypothetical protein
MKSPPHQVSDNVARQMTDDFITEAVATLRSQSLRGEHVRPAPMEGNGAHAAEVGETVVPPAGA